MLLNYLKLAIRLLVRNPFFTFINVLGLSVGFAVFFILWQYSQSELKSDQLWKGWERIYRFGMIAKWSDDKVNWQESPFGGNDAAFARQVAQDYTEVEDLTRILVQKNFASSNNFESYVKNHGTDIFLTIEHDKQVNRFLETRIVYADPNVFSFFSTPFVTGNAKSCLNLAGSVVLSKSKARKYFGDKNPLGKTLLLNGKIPTTVTGVFENLPRNTHLDFDIVLSSESIKNTITKINQPWSGPHCYFKLKKSTDAHELSNRINKDLKDLIKKVAFGDWVYGTGAIYLQRLADTSFISYRHDYYQTKTKPVLIVLKYASIVILLMAWINYVNLSLSSNRKRLKEVATRKTVGARSGDFVIQFLLEAIIMNFVSFLLAITFIQLLKSPIDLFFQFYIPDWKDISLSTILIIFSAFTAGILLTGIYPAFISLNRTPNPFGNLKCKEEKNGIHVAMTTFQFGVAVILIVWIFIVYGQMEFVMKKDIGLNKEQVLVLDLPINRSENFKTELNSFLDKTLTIKSVGKITVSQSVPGDEGQKFIGLVWRADDAGMAVETNGGIDEHFIPFYEIKLVAGRNFLPDHPSNKSSVIISEASATRLGFSNPDSALGQRIFVGTEVQAEVIGIIKDYKLRPLLNQGYNYNYGGNPGLALTYKDYILPLASHSIPKKISLRISPDKLPEALPVIEKYYQELFPGEIFNWYFLDHVITGKYQQHKLARNQITFFTCLAIGIACLGLLGMISNKVAEKTKEIGIRKVLGAQLYQIAKVLLNTTIKQVIIATVIGIPVAYFLTQQYLEKFSERISLQWWHLALPVVLLITIMFVTIASVIWKASRTNPVESLRYE